MRTASRIPLFLLCAMFFVGCSRDDSNLTAGSGLTDDALETQIKSRLNEDPQLRAANLDVDADASDHKVTLSGTVETESLRARAVDLTKASYPAAAITDKIDVKPRELTRAEYTEELAVEERRRAKEFGESVGESIDDAWIHSKIVAKLIVNSATPERKINVDVEKNAVTLRGTVDTAEARATAERMARETEGVKSVNNMLKVGG